MDVVSLGHFADFESPKSVRNWGFFPIFAEKFGSKMKKFLYVVGLALILASCNSKEGKGHEDAGSKERSELSEYEQKETAGSTVEFVQQLKNDGALEATVDDDGYVVYTVDSHIDQIRDGDGKQLAEHIVAKAKAQGLEITGCKVYDQATGNELATAK